MSWEDIDKEVDNMAACALWDIRTQVLKAATDLNLLDKEFLAKCTPALVFRYTLEQEILRTFNRRWRYHWLS